MLVNRKGKKQNKKKEHDYRLDTYKRKKWKGTGLSGKHFRLKGISEKMSVMVKQNFSKDCSLEGAFH